MIRGWSGWSAGLIEKIRRRYDPENDVGTPDVTWVDSTLLELIMELESRVNLLESEVKSLRREQGIWHGK